MKTIFSYCLTLALATMVVTPVVAADAKAEAEKKAAAARAALVKAAKGRLDKVLGELTSRSRRAGTAEIVKGIEDFVANDADATNREVRVYADQKCLDFCSRRTARIGGRYGQFDADFAAAKTESVARRILADTTAPKAEKLTAADYYCTSLCNAERYEEALKVADGVIAMKDPFPPVNSKALRLRMTIYRWWNKYDEALEVGRELCKLHPGNMESVAFMMNDFEHYDDAFDLWQEYGGEKAEFNFYQNVTAARKIFNDRRYHDGIVKRLRAWIRDEKNPVELRFKYAADLGLLSPDTPEAAADRAVFKGVDFSEKKFSSCNVNFISSHYVYGNWAHFTRLMDEFATFTRPDLKSPKFRRAYAMALAYQGRTDEALVAVAECHAVEGLKPVDAAMYDALEAVLRGKDALLAIRKLDLPAKELLGVYLLPAQFSLNLGRNDECRRYAEAYQKLFKAIPHRSVDVPWFDTPVRTVDAWRQIRGELKPTFVDIKMCGDLDNLETDVATGRSVVKPSEADVNKLKIEVTQLCDVEALHLFLAVKDKDARLVEKGFSGGFGNEMYFAPGANQPYLCFGIGPKVGLEYAFQTSYSSFDHTRLERATSDRDTDALRCEVGFSDDEYVFHLIFPWEAFYQKLPLRPGTAWKFDCLCWGNGCSWGGSQGVHEASSWGDLVFNLTPAQGTAIRRRILFNTFRGWNAAPEGKCAPFDRWADDVIGDPEFYQTCLKPLEDELKGYVARVKPDMSDDDVNEIYAKGVQRWMGLKYEIDLLRRNYLTQKNTRCPH